MKSLFHSSEIYRLWGITYLATDLIYTRLDPRIRLNSQGNA